MEDVNWYLINAQGQPLIKDAYRDFCLLDENWIAVKSGYWKLLHRSKSRPQNFESNNKIFSEVERINDYLAVTVDNDSLRIQLWHIPTQQFIRSEPIATLIQPTPENPQRTYYPWYAPLDEHYALYQPARGSSKLLHNNGKIAPTLFHDITFSGKPGTYYVNFRGDWGILAPALDSMPIVDYYYDEIFPFQQDIAICRKGKKYGAYLIKNGQLDSLPCMFDYITVLDSGRIWTPSGENIIQYKVNNEGKFIIDKIIPEVFAVDRNVKKTNVEAPLLPIQSLKLYEPPVIKEDLIQIKQSGDSTVVIKMHEVIVSRTEKQFVPKWTKKIRLQTPLTGALEVIEDQILAFYQAGIVSNNRFTQMLSKGALQQVRFFAVKNWDFIKTPPMLGFRAFDTLSKYTVFIDTSGQMGILDRSGHEVQQGGKAIRYTYIGPFIHGRARAYLGGKIIIDEQDSLKIPYKYQLSNQLEFTKEFNIKEVNISIFTRGQKDMYAHGGKWVYINETGNIILEPNAGYVDNFHPQDQTAFIYKTNQQEILGKPDADCGIINQNGNIILPIQYSNIVRDEAYFMIGLDSTPTFYFNKKGQQIFENPTRLRPFSGGLAQFMDVRERWGYVDTNGIIVIPAQYKMARPFSEGLAMVVDSLNNIIFIDNNGAIALKTNLLEKEWRGIGDFHNGRCWFKQKGNAWIWGCYNKQGEIIIPAKYFYTPSGNSFPAPDEAYPLPMDFSQGAAAVTTLDSTNRKIVTVIDTSGNMIISPGNYEQIMRFDEYGYAIFKSNKNSLHGLLDHEGKVVVPARYHHIKSFANGYAKVGNNRGSWGLINFQGKEVLPLQYSEIDTVSEGLVAVKTLGMNSWMVVDTNNQVRLRGPFEKIKPFQQGLTFAVAKNRSLILNSKGEAVDFKVGKPIFFGEGLFGVSETLSGTNNKERYFYADGSGNNLFGRYFGSINEYQLGVAKVANETSKKESRKLLGAINNRGVLIVPLKYNNLHIQPDGNIIINPQRLFGLANKNGKILLAPAYDRISRFRENDLFRVERGEKVGYLRIKNDQVEWIWALTN
ncbi:MAG: WG repeat-containing protein [Saprospiraceae bacterium]